MRMPTSQTWFTEGSSRKLPRTNKNVIIETGNEKNIYTNVKSRSKRIIKLLSTAHV